MIRPKVFHGTYSMTCANSVLPTFMRHPRSSKPGSFANVQSEIQIVDTHEFLKTRFCIGFSAFPPYINRTLLLGHGLLSDTKPLQINVARPKSELHRRSLPLGRIPSS